MTKIIVGDLHEMIAAAGIPIDGVALLKDGSIRVDYQDVATPEQKAQAGAIIKTYDQDAAKALPAKPSSKKWPQRNQLIGSEQE